MSLDKNNLQYSKIAKLFHWGFVLLFVYGVAKQVDDINQLEDKAFFRFEIIFAVIFLFLLLIRLIYMKTTQKTSLPEDTPKAQKLAAQMGVRGVPSLFFYKNGKLIKNVSGVLAKHEIKSIFNL